MVTVQSPAAAPGVPTFTVGWLRALSLIVGGFGGVCTRIPSVAVEGENVTPFDIRALTTTCPFALLVVYLT
ncbi:MAG: hypothetical protein ACYCZP_12615 [Acidimicrobiales bacterium]|jgi:hypothetical protein